MGFSRTWSEYERVNEPESLYVADRADRSRVGRMNHQNAVPRVLIFAVLCALVLSLFSIGAHVSDPGAANRLQSEGRLTATVSPGIRSGISPQSGPSATGPYFVNVTESGLPSSTLWSVILDARTSYSPSTQIVIGGVANGTYQLEVSAIPGYNVSMSNWTVAVNGSNVNYTVAYSAFTDPAYDLSVKEFGFVSPEAWNAVVVGIGYVTSGSRISTVAVPAGDYTLFAGYESGYTDTGPQNWSSVQVTSAGGSASVYFYDLSFLETGLPNGTAWSVTFSWTQNGTPLGSSVTTFGSVAGSNFPNGSVTWTISPVTGYNLSVANGTSVIAGAPVDVPVEFIPPLYAVTFNASGLPAGPIWSVTVGSTWTNSSTPELVVDLANGSYNYDVRAPAGYLCTTPTGSVTVNGTAVSVAVAFVETFSVTFSESGLAPGASWNVTLGSTTNVSTGSTLTFEVVNGTYNYTISGPSGFTPVPASGSVTVSGAPQTRTVAFLPPTFPMTFDESGLRAGTAWSVTLTAAGMSPLTENSTTPSIVVDLENGSYNFSVGAVPGFTANPPTGTFSVSGTPEPVSVQFSPVPASYPVTFVVTGAVGWAIEIDGKNLTPVGSADSVVINLTNGSYNYSVYAPSPYSAMPPSGQVIVNGAARSVSITLQEVSTGPPPVSNSPNNLWVVYAIIGVVAVAVILSATLAVRRMRRKPGVPPST